MSKPIDARSVVVTRKDGKYAIRVEEWLGDEYTIRGVKVKIRFHVEVYDYGDTGYELKQEIIADEILLEKPEEE